MADNVKPIPKCSFCGKTQNQVKKLIAAPGVFICNECVDLCCEILTEESDGSFGWKPKDPIELEGRTWPAQVMWPAPRPKSQLSWLFDFETTGDFYPYQSKQEPKPQAPL